MTHPKLVQLEFASYALSLLKGAGDIPLAADLAAKHQFDFPRAAAILKAAVPAGTTADSTWASKLTEYQQVAAGFVNGKAVFPSCGNSDFPTRLRCVVVG